MPSTIQSSAPRPRRGVTMIELMIAVSIMSVLVGALAVMANAVHQSSDYSHGYGLAVQHARVVIERIERTINQATATEDFPGAIVLDETLSGWRFPHTLVVWHPEIAAVNPDGPPLIGELVIYCPNPDAPHELLEITSPGDVTPAPASADSSDWSSIITGLKSDPQSKKIVLTDLLRVGTVTELGAGNLSAQQGCVRFEIDVFPSQTQWNDYQSGSLAWEDLPWVQDIYGSETGLRQTWVRMELQLTPGDVESAYAPDALVAIPFFGSAALYYELNR